MVTVGLDLHKGYITACALNETGMVLAEHRRLEPSLDALGRWLGGLAQPLLVAREATVYWHWMERQLTARGFAVIIAHPYQVKPMWQAQAKTDPIDARKLAELARVKLLPGIWIPDPETRALRQLQRDRVFLVRQRTVMRNRIHAHFSPPRTRCPELDLYSKAGQAWLATVDLPAEVRGQVSLILANHALQQTRSFGTRQGTRCARVQHADLLRSVAVNAVR